MFLRRIHVKWDFNEWVEALDAPLREVFTREERDLVDSRFKDRLRRKQVVASSIFVRHAM